MNGLEVVIITGVSGSGKSTALDAFEDLGFSCVNNLPVPLIQPYTEFLLEESEVQERREAAGDIAEKKYALLVDCRAERAFGDVKKAIGILMAKGVSVSLLFLECRDEIAIKRFRETRRPHPLHLSAVYPASISEALARERKLLADIREAATNTIDTSAFTPHNLREWVEEFCGTVRQLPVVVTSFGYKYGNPTDADLVLDVRFLPNPHFVEELKPLNGKHSKVRDYVFSDGQAQECLTRYSDLLSYLLPLYKDEGKRYITIAIGCTGGQHRSVALSISLCRGLREAGWNATVKHRDAV